MKSNCRHYFKAQTKYVFPLQDFLLGQCSTEFYFGRSERKLRPPYNWFRYQSDVNQAPAPRTNPTQLIRQPLQSLSFERCHWVLFHHGTHHFVALIPVANSRLRPHNLFQSSTDREVSSYNQSDLPSFSRLSPKGLWPRSQPFWPVPDLSSNLSVAATEFCTCLSNCPGLTCSLCSHRRYTILFNPVPEQLAR